MYSICRNAPNNPQRSAFSVLGSQFFLPQVFSSHSNLASVHWRWRCARAATAQLRASYWRPCRVPTDMQPEVSLPSREAEKKTIYLICINWVHRTIYIQVYSSNLWFILFHSYFGLSRCMYSF